MPLKYALYGDPVPLKHAKWPPVGGIQCKCGSYPRAQASRVM